MKTSKFQMIWGLITLSVGVALMVVGTDYGRIFNVTAGLIAGSVMVILGISRLKYAWRHRNG